MRLNIRLLFVARATAVIVFGIGAMLFLPGAVLAQFDPRDDPGPGLGLDLLENKSVQQELRLTEEQIAKIKKVTSSLEKRMNKAFEDAFKQKLSEKETEKKLNEMEREIDSETARIIKENLKPDQAMRFRQIERQVTGVKAFSMEDVAKELKLTDAQKDEIKKITETLAKDRRDVLKGTSGAKRKEAYKKVEGMRKEALEKITGLLSAEQKREWKEMVGEPFELKLASPAPRKARSK